MNIDLMLLTEQTPSPPGRVGVGEIELRKVVPWPQ